MQAVVLGAGIVGRAAAWDLARRGHQVTVADRDGDAASAVAAEIGAAAAQADAASAESVRQLLEGGDVVLSAVPYTYGVEVLQAAIAARTHYLDFGGNSSVVSRQLQLHDAAAAAGVVAVPDCGLAPGLANVLATGCVDDLGPGPIRELRLRVGALPQRPFGSLGYQLAFSPTGLINEYSEPCHILTAGTEATVEPLTGFENVAWDVWGPLEAFNTAGGASTLPRHFAGRVDELDYKTLRYPGHGAAFRAMYEIGLFDDSSGPPSPRSMLLDALAGNLPSGQPDVVLVRVWATAEREGASITRGMELEDVADDTFSALARTTAFPATALADLIARSRGEPGVRTMADAVSRDELLAELGPLGIVPRPLAS